MSKKIQCKVVPSTWLELEEHRLNAKPYFSGAIEAKLALENFDCEDLVTLTEGGKKGIFNGPRFSRVFVDDPEHGLKLFSGADIVQSDLSYTDLIAKWQARLMPEMILKEGTILISSYGTIGRCVYTRRDMAGHIGSDNVMKVVLDATKILPGYLYSFLSSKFGLPLVIKGEGGSVITYLDPSRVHSIPIPRLGMVEDRAHALVQKAADELSDSVSLMREATDRLLKEAGLSESENHKYLNDERRMGWAETSLSKFSLRALNYDPRTKNLWRAVTEIKHDKLGDIVSRDNFEGYIVFSRIDCEPEYGTLLVGQREAFFLRPGGRWISRKSIEGLGLVVPPRTTIIPCQGTLGESEVYCRAVYVTERCSQYAYSGHFYRCIPVAGAIEPGYLYAFMRSRFAFRMMRSISIGSKQQYQHPKLMAAFPIPRIDTKMEKLIAEMVDRAGALQDHALSLEDEAIALVEHTIEEGSR
jgi:hypothetical protein